MPVQYIPAQYDTGSWVEPYRSQNQRQTKINKMLQNKPSCLLYTHNIKADKHELSFNITVNIYLNYQFNSIGELARYENGQWKPVPFTSEIAISALAIFISGYTTFYYEVCRLITIYSKNGLQPIFLRFKV